MEDHVWPQETEAKRLSPFAQRMTENMSRPSIAGGAWRA